MRLDNKVALITGAASGIGRASALLFAGEGARVSVVDKNAEMGRQVREEVREAGGEAVFVEADVSDPSACKAMVQQTVEAYGRRRPGWRRSFSALRISSTTSGTTSRTLSTRKA